MNIVAIYGAEHQGSTYHIAQAFLKKLFSAADNITEFYLPKDMPHFCRGCGLCFTKNEELCPHYQEVNTIKEAMEKADFLLLASPVYVYHVTGQMKTLLDHFGYQWIVHRPNKTMLSTNVAVMGAEKTDFSDIPDDWSKTAIENAIQNGLLMGDNGLVKPKDNLTRAQMAAIVNRAFASSVKADISSFTDVQSTAWYYDDMAKAVQMGTFAGDGANLNPDNKITRQEAFAVLARAFKINDGSDSDLANYSDASSVASWAKGSVSAMIASGYVSGSAGQVLPTANITRAEFAKVMDNMLKTYIKTEGTVSTVADGNVMIDAAGVTLQDVTVNGDLILGDGIGDGDVTLNNVKVTGRVVVRGGGENSIHITGNSEMSNIVVSRVDGKVRIAIADGTNVKEINAADGEEILIEGTVGNVNVTGEGLNINLASAKVTSVDITSANSTVTVGKDSTVSGNVTIAANADASKVVVAGTVANVVSSAANSTVSVAATGKVTNVDLKAEAKNAAITVEKGATVTAVATAAEGAKLSGEGTVSTVNVSGNNTTVNTNSTKVIVASGATGTTSAGTSVAAGATTTTSSTASSTTTTPGSTNPPSTGGSSGGGSSSGGGTAVVSYVVTVSSGGYAPKFSNAGDIALKTFVLNNFNGAKAAVNNSTASSANKTKALADLTTLYNTLSKNNTIDTSTNDTMKSWLDKVTKITETGSYTSTTLAAIKADLIADYNSGKTLTEFRAKYGTLTVEVDGKTATISIA